MVVPKLKCSFLRETDEYSRLCEQERYRNGASMSKPSIKLSSAPREISE